MLIRTTLTVRNAFQSAIAIAVHRPDDPSQIKLQVKHFQKVAMVAAEFDDYLFRTHNKQSDEYMAMYNMIRAAVDAGN